MNSVKFLNTREREKRTHLTKEMYMTYNTDLIIIYNFTAKNISIWLIFNERKKSDFMQ
jgi:hypothetical protein